MMTCRDLGRWAGSVGALCALLAVPPIASAQEARAARDERAAEPAAPEGAIEDVQLMFSVRLIQIDRFPAWKDGAAPSIRVTRAAAQEQMLAQTRTRTASTTGEGATSVGAGKVPVLLADPEAELIIGAAEDGAEGAVRVDLADSSGPGVELLSSPRLIVNAGQEASIQVGEYVTHLERDPDGCLREVESEAFEGLTVRVNLRPEEDHEGIVVLDMFELTLSEVVGRRPIDGVRLDAGVPIIRTRAVSMELAMSEDVVAVVPVYMMSEDAAGILAVLEARVLGRDQRRP